jgi:hypothetical protein
MLSNVPGICLKCINRHNTTCDKLQCLSSQDTAKENSTYILKGSDDGV